MVHWKPKQDRSLFYASPLFTRAEQRKIETIDHLLKTAGPLIKKVGTNMDLKGFFEINSISLDIISCFDMWKKGNCTKSECIANSKSIIRDYKGEDGEYLIAQMSYYWCLLNSNIVDNKLKTKLESYSLQEITKWYPEEGKLVYDVLVSLLKEDPKPFVKKSISYSKLRWKPGDVYAIPMPADTKALCDFDQNTMVYVLISCDKIINESSRNQDIIAYIFLHLGELEDDLSSIMSNCIALPVRRVYTGKDIFLYKYYFYKITQNCPEEQLRYLGYFDNNRIIFVNEYIIDDYLFCGWTTWSILFRDVVHQYNFFKEINH